MKIRAEITAVEDRGDCLMLTMQGIEPTAATGRPLVRQVLSVAASDKNRRAFFVGRHVMIDARPMR